MGSVTRSQAVHARERRAEVVERVLGAVEELLATGERFTEIPVQRIAADSGMSRTNFYQYFPNKSQVLIQVADVASAEFFAAPTSWFADDASLDAGVAGVERAIASMVAEFRKHWTLMRALGEVSAYDTEVAEFWFGRINTFIDFAAGQVARWRAAGRVDPSVTTESVAAVTWMVERSVTQYALGPRQEGSDDKLIAALSRTIWLTVTAGAD
ncbi:TetR/AcrR family transcriptional regulator [Gordonia insulae]|uniref:HTH-type transcriptional regulator EthR n=1 Tax=Gordonia insulae TaxID=2420509 RepID=A0A3G8JQ28_9ACTN|nr:TetR/AcrR family transcriptional regulator [Gordonia insulae]AZG47088.1 HTH-type transcriptional regulator EthR [Gordonia insulae]